jgi:hypothetical protein
VNKRSLKGWLKNAFALDAEPLAIPNAEDQAIIDRLAQAIVSRGLTAPALLLLECARPLNYVSGQFMRLIAPFAELLFDQQQYARLASFLERRGSIEYICRRVEAIDRRTATDDARSDVGEADDQTP